MPVTTVPKPLTVKTRSIGNRNTARARSRCGQRIESGRELGADVVEPGAGLGRRGEDRRVRERRGRDRGADVGAHHREPFLIDQIALRQHDQASTDPEQVADVEVLAGLRHHAFVRGDHEDHDIDARRAGDHRLHEPLVARHVDHREPLARELERCEPELGRDPALLLDRQAVRVDTGQRLHQRRLAVVDVTGGADDDRVNHRESLR